MAESLGPLLGCRVQGKVCGLRSWIEDFQKINIFLGFGISVLL